MPKEEASNVRFERVSKPTVQDEGFRIKERRFTQQYSNIYFARLVSLKPAVVDAAAVVWSQRMGAIYVERIVNVRQSNNLVYFIGTMYIDQPLKPNILKEISTEVRRFARQGKTWPWFGNHAFSYLSCFQLLLYPGANDFSLVLFHRHRWRDTQARRMNSSLRTNLGESSSLVPFSIVSFC
jgi:hypothetical protein